MIDKVTVDVIVGRVFLHASTQPAKLPTLSRVGLRYLGESYEQLSRRSIYYPSQYFPQIYESAIVK